MRRRRKGTNAGGLLVLAIAAMCFLFTTYPILAIVILCVVSIAGALIVFSRQSTRIAVARDLPVQRSPQYPPSVHRDISKILKSVERAQKWETRLKYVEEGIRLAESAGMSELAENWARLRETLVREGKERIDSAIAEDMGTMRASYEPQQKIAAARKIQSKLKSLGQRYAEFGTVQSYIQELLETIERETESDRASLEEIGKAQQSEKSGHLQGAVDHYLSALQSIRKDDVDDSKQQMLIATLEEKVKSLFKRASLGARTPSGKRGDKPLPGLDSPLDERKESEWKTGGQTEPATEHGAEKGAGK